MNGLCEPTAGPRLRGSVAVIRWRPSALRWARSQAGSSRPVWPGRPRCCSSPRGCCGGRRSCLLAPAWWATALVEPQPSWHPMWEWPRRCSSSWARRPDRWHCRPPRAERRAW